MIHEKNTFTSEEKKVFVKHCVEYCLKSVPYYIQRTKENETNQNERTENESIQNNLIHLKEYYNKLAGYIANDPIRRFKIVAKLQIKSQHTSKKNLSDMDIEDFLKGFQGLTGKVDGLSDDQIDKIINDIMNEGFIMPNYNINRANDNSVILLNNLIESILKIEKQIKTKSEFKPNSFGIEINERYNKVVNLHEVNLDVPESPQVSPSIRNRLNASNTQPEVHKVDRIDYIRRFLLQERKSEAPQVSSPINRLNATSLEIPESSKYSINFNFNNNNKPPRHMGENNVTTMKNNLKFKQRGRLNAISPSRLRNNLTSKTTSKSKSKSNYTSHPNRSRGLVKPRKGPVIPVFSRTTPKNPPTNKPGRTNKPRKTNKSKPKGTSI